MLDIIGIGTGPFDLSLAALLESQPDINCKFFEQKTEFNWHKGMIFPHTTLQVPFMADLVTLIDPTSHYTFLNYLHKHHRLLKFYFLEDFEIYRKEYNHYCQWVAAQLSSLVFNTKVIDVTIDREGFKVTVCECGEEKNYMTKNIVVGTGSQPSMPSFLQEIAQRAPHQCMHTAHFSKQFDLDSIDREGRLPKVLVLGSGQSAAEVYRVLFDQQLVEKNTPKFQLDWMTRSAGFFPMEYTPLGLEYFSPAYIDYFYHLDPVTKLKVIAKQDLLHKGISVNTIKEIYHKLYERSIANQETYSEIIGNCELLGVTLDSVSNNNMLHLTVKQREQDRSFMVEYDCIIIGTGYRDKLPKCLKSLSTSIKYDEFDQPIINRDYTLGYQHPLTDSQDAAQHRGRIFVQNKETHSHGIGAGDLGLGAYRAGYIVNQLLGKKVYDTDSLEVFQKFGIK